MEDVPKETVTVKSEEPKEDNKYTRMAVMASICIGVVFFLGMIVFSATMADNSIYTGNITDIYKPPHNGPEWKVINFTIGPNGENLPNTSIYIPNETETITATGFYGNLEWQINENYTGNDSNYTEGNQT